MCCVSLGEVFANIASSSHFTTRVRKSQNKLCNKTGVGRGKYPKCTRVGNYIGLLQIFKTLEKYSSQHFLNPTALYAILLAHHLVLVLVADGEFSPLSSWVRILSQYLSEGKQGKCLREVRASITHQGASQVPASGQRWYYPLPAHRGVKAKCLRPVRDIPLKGRDTSLKSEIPHREASAIPHSQWDKSSQVPAKALRNIS